MMSDAEFNAGLDACVDWVQFVLSQHNTKDLTPVVVAHTYTKRTHQGAGRVAPESMILVLHNYSSDHHQAILMEVGKLLAHQEKAPIATYFICEAWTTAEDDLDDVGQRIEKYKRLENDPDREEAIYIVGKSYDGRNNAAQVRIGRAADGTMRALDTLFFRLGASMKIPGGADLCTDIYRGFSMGILARQIEALGHSDRHQAGHDRTEKGGAKWN